MRKHASGNFNIKFSSCSESENTRQNARQMNRLDDIGKMALYTGS
jgi:hypothetical protein